MVRLSIDFEFSPRDWWANGGQDLWEALAEAFDGAHVVVEENLANSWLEQARAIPGWDLGPEYAPHPVRLSELNEDDEELL
jgi:hypothetical protein